MFDSKNQLDYANIVLLGLIGYVLFYVSITKSQHLEEEELDRDVELPEIYQKYG